MAIKTGAISAAEQLKKLREEEERIDQEAASKKAAVQAKMAELNASVTDELVSRGMSLIEDFREAGHSAWAAIKMLAGKANVSFTGKEVTSKAAKSSGGDRKGTRTTNPDRPCPICEFKTVPPHDARRHRGQSEKRPFTAEELETLGMKKT